MTEYTYHTVEVARYELNGWYTLKELEQLVVDLKECNERAKNAMRELRRRCEGRAAKAPMGSDEQCEAEDCTAAIRARGES
jgi:hypothetical protein